MEAEMQDLNDLSYFAAVVAHGGFAPAGRALKQPKSKLSRRVAQLEANLGVRLIERSTRRFRVTEVGQAFYERCRTIMLEVEQAEAVAAEAQGEPRGLVRVSCPPGLLESITGIFTAYLQRYPKVTLQLLATTRRISLIDERVDIAFRVRSTLDNDAGLTMRRLTTSRQILVATPELAARATDMAQLGAPDGVPTLSYNEATLHDSWVLTNAAGETRTINHDPRFVCSDFGALRDAVVAGLGVTLMPNHSCWPWLQSGALVQIFPEWSAPEGIVHLVFTTKRGLPPAVRALIDHIAEGFREERHAARQAGVPDLAPHPAHLHPPVPRPKDLANL